MAVADFDSGRDVAILDEVRVRGIWLSDLGIGTIPKKQIDDGYVIIKDSTGSAYAVLYFPAIDGASVEKGLRALIDADGVVTVAGFRETFPSAAVTADLIARGLAAGPPVVVLAPYFGDREAALADRVQDEMLLSAVIAGVNLIFLAIAVIKARNWRRRVAARKRPMTGSVTASVTGMPRVSAVAARAAGPSRTAIPTPPQSARAIQPQGWSRRDDFASGPIQSPKGWFR